MSEEKELQEAIGGWNKSKIGKFFLQKEVRWVFNLPAASHIIIIIIVNLY